MAETLWVEALDKLYRVGGAPFVLKMLDTFLEQMDERRRNAERAIDDGDWATATRIFHSYKSSAGLLGALQLQSLLSELEEVAGRSDATGARERFAALDACLVETRSALLGERARAEESIRSGNASSSQKSANS
jgi:HPt (histidine-containing phosphotransfer) domain-containing protein